MAMNGLGSWDNWLGVGLCMWSPMTVVAISMRWLVAPTSLWVLADALDDAMAISGRLGEQPWFSAWKSATMSKGGVEIYDAMPPCYLYS